MIAIDDENVTQRMREVLKCKTPQVLSAKLEPDLIQKAITDLAVKGMKVTTGTEECVLPKIICDICLVRERRICFLPCGHVVCCRECSEPATTCYVCRAFIDEKKVLYFS